jgi:hypothetical protein
MYETLQAIKTHLNADPELTKRQIYLVDSPTKNKVLAYYNKNNKRQIMVAELTIQEHTIDITINLYHYSINLHDPNFLKQITQHLSYLWQAGWLHN